MEARRTTQIIDQNSLNSASSSPIFASGSGGSIVAGSYFDTLTASQNPSTSTLYVSGGAAVFPGNGAYGGQQIGDIVGNIRSIRLGAARRSWARCTKSMRLTTAPVLAALRRGLHRVGGGTVGHPSDAWGWAAGAGLRLNFPMIGQGDYFQAQVNVTKARSVTSSSPRTRTGAKLTTAI